MLLQALPPLRAAFLLRLSQGFCLNRSVSIDAEGSHVPHTCCMTISRHLNAGGRQARNRFFPGLSRNNDSAPVLTSFLRFRHVIEWFTFVRLLVTYLIQFLPDLFLPCSRPELLTRAAEGDLRPAPVHRSRGASYPSSVVQLRTTPSSSTRSCSWRTVIRIPNQCRFGPLRWSVLALEDPIKPVQINVGQQR